MAGSGPAPGTATSYDIGVPKMHQDRINEAAEKAAGIEQLAPATKAPAAPAPPQPAPVERARLISEGLTLLDRIERLEGYFIRIMESLAALKLEQQHDDY